MEKIFLAAAVAAILVIVYNHWKASTKSVLKNENEYRCVEIVHSSALFTNTIECRAILSLDQWFKNEGKLQVIIRVDFEIYDDTKKCSSTIVWTKDNNIEKEICRIYSPGYQVYYVVYAKYNEGNEAIEVSLRREGSEY